MGYRNSTAKSKSNVLGTYPVTSVIFSSILALFTLGLFLLLVLHAAKLSDIIKNSVKIQLYLHNNIKDEEIIKLERIFSSKDFVLKKDCIPQISYISKEQAAKSFIQETGTDFFQMLGENPLRNSFVLSIDHHYHDSKSLEYIKKELEEIKGVFEVDYIGGFVDSVNKNISTIGMVLMVLVAVLFIVVSLLIANTIRLSIYSQRFIIRSMELVGATHNFIKKPFLIRSVLIGLISSSIVSSILLIILWCLNVKVPYISQLQDVKLVFCTIVFIHLIAVWIMYTGTNRSVNKYLKMSLDDLY